MFIFTNGFSSQIELFYNFFIFFALTTKQNQTPIKPNLRTSCCDENFKLQSFKHLKTLGLPKQSHSCQVMELEMYCVLFVLSVKCYRFWKRIWKRTHNLNGSVSIAASMGFFSLIIGWNKDIVLSFYMCAWNKASFKYTLLSKTLFTCLRLLCPPEVRAVARRGIWASLMFSFLLPSSLHRY